MTSRLVALLRGINVGGRRRIRMAELRQVLGQVGLDGVETLLQSGNVVVEGSDPEAVAATIRRAIGETFGLEVGVLTRTAEDLEAVAERNPFPEAAEDDPKRLHVVFLSEAPDPDTFAELDPVRADDDELALRGRELYVHYGEAGAGRSPLDLARLERALGLTATARNWNTVLRLVDAAGTPGDR